MLRICLTLLISSFFAASSASAQQWASKMFETTRHEFGTLARGAKAQFRFKLTNLYEEGVHITGVRSSCGCTTPLITHSDLKTFEEGEIVADLNTRSFIGFKSATLFVSFDKPFPAEVQLLVSGFIRSDVVLEPGEIDLGTVALGAGAETKVAITYAGREDWKVLDVKSANPHFECELFETGRARGKVSYDLLVRLTKDAPAGYIKDQLNLVTTDKQATELPLQVQGRVAASLTVSPPSLFMGVVKPGQKVRKQLVVRSRSPFKIVEVRCPDKSFQIAPSTASKAVHLIPVVFTAGDHIGKISQQISIVTDQDGTAAECTAYAEIVEAGKPAKERAALTRHRETGDAEDTAAPDAP